MASYTPLADALKVTLTDIAVENVENDLSIDQYSTARFEAMKNWYEKLDEVYVSHLPQDVRNQINYMIVALPNHDHQYVESMCKSMVELADLAIKSSN